MASEKACRLLEAPSSDTQKKKIDAREMKYHVGIEPYLQTFCSYYAHPPWCSCKLCELGF